MITSIKVFGKLQSATEKYRIIDVTLVWVQSDLW